MDARELAQFYQARMGQRARRLILEQVAEAWPKVKGLRILGYGFAIPFLRPFMAEAERVAAASPAEMGVIRWPSDSPLTSLCDEDALPFPDAFFDRVLVVHGLEGAQSLRPLLRQLWRVLTPEGKMLVVAANRTSLWAQVERSPFAQGRPFSRRELDELLKGAMFEPESWRHALFTPPVPLARGRSWERVGHRLFPALGGVHIAEVRKSLYAPARPKPLAAPALGALLKPAGTD
jgi:SAM-dependent methyltransferase